MSFAALKTPPDTAQSSHRETADYYAGELFREGRYRVAVCRDGVQWLFQRQTGAGTLRGPEWRSLGYCTTRDALNRLWRRETENVPDALASLPERIRRRAE